MAKPWSKIDSKQKEISAGSLDVRSKEIRFYNAGTADNVSLVQRILSRSRASPGNDSPALTGTPTAPTAAADTNTQQIATTGFVIGQVGTATPNMDGTGDAGTSLRYSRQDHTHPTDTSRAASGHNHDAAYAAIGHNHDGVYARRVSVPSTATSTGSVGDYAADSSYLYICTASNTWRRVAIASW